MELMKLSDVCKKYHFTRRVIQGYEKEGLVKHIGRNKYGYLIYDKKTVKKIAYIRYLQINGLTLNEIAKCLNQKKEGIPKSVLLKINSKHNKKIRKIKKLIKRNEEIIKLNKEKEILEIVIGGINDEENY